VESGSAPDERPYIVVCSPNYLHVPHAVFALNASCPVLLEKPVACSFGEYSFLRDFVGNGPCFAVLQMRYNHAVSNLRRRKFTGGEKIEFYYCAARGSWYNSSWKGDSRKSGGALFNIGIHAIDIMIDVFGVIRSFEYNGLSLSGEHKFRVCFDGSEVDFYFGLGRNLREFCIDGQRYPLNVNKELHQLMYEDLFAGRGVHVGVLADTVLACEKFRAASGV
jgi:UDP-N-acetyl-2-amino-2-deoxyglucuronate dehydrogenase